MQKVDTPDPISAVVDIPAGRVLFIAAERAGTTVEVLPADASKGRDVTVAEQTPSPWAARCCAPRPATCRRGVSASLDAGTGYGRIDNALMNTDGTADLTIHATTAYGDVVARSL